MRFILLSGKSVWKNIEKTRIDWNKKSISKPQFQLKQFLKKYWERDVVYEEMPIPTTRLRCDFVNFTKKIAIEEHGSFHQKYNSWAHKSRSGYLNSLSRDNKKMLFLQKNGFQFVEIYDYEVKDINEKWFFEKFGIRL